MREAFRKDYQRSSQDVDSYLARYYHGHHTHVGTHPRIANFIFFAVLGVNLVGDGLREAFQQEDRIKVPLPWGRGR
jgi:hypothetical protein